MICPKFQSSGNASRFILSFATEVCKGYGYDIVKKNGKSIWY
jgi:hypothetical protein